MSWEQRKNNIHKHYIVEKQFDSINNFQYIQSIHV